MIGDFYGVVTVYSPPFSYLENISTYAPFLKELLVVDNSPDNVDRTVELNQKFPNIRYFKVDNIGVGAALNLGLKLGLDQGCSWLLTMDQDSKFGSGDFLKFMETRTLNPDIAIVSPNNENLKKENFIAIGKNNKLSAPEYVLTSGNLVDIKVLASLGGYRSDFFIDWIDIEICYRIKKMGHEILVDWDVVFEHHLGVIMHYDIFSKKIPITIHSAQRYYYMVRNAGYVLIGYLNFRDMRRLLVQLTKVFIFKRNRLDFLSSVLIGLYHFLINKKGKHILKKNTP